LSKEAIRKIPWSEELADEIQDALESPDVLDQKFALFFAETLFHPDVLDAAHEARFVSRMTTLLDCGSDPVKPYALRLLVRFHARVVDFRERVMKALGSEEAGVRHEALAGYELCCKAKEVEPLERFEHDPYYGEIAMGGPLRFDLRDEALSVIERVLGVGFTRFQKVESLPGGRNVAFWSWEPYHRSKQPPWRKWFWNPFHR